MEGMPTTSEGTAEAPPINTAAFGKKPKTVLAIDDSPDIRLIINETLNLFGFKTLIAEDGMTGIKMAQEHLPDLIICDIKMPKLDGYDTLKAMREHESTAMIPFMFLSGATDRVTVRKGMELGADDYLTKPFSPKELTAAVNARLEKQAEMQRLSDRKLNELRGNLSLALQNELLVSEAKTMAASDTIKPVAVQELEPPLARRVAARQKLKGDLLMTEEK